MRKIDVKEDCMVSRLLIDEYKGGLKFGRLMKLFRDKDIKINGKRISGDVAVVCGDIVEVYFDAEAKNLPVIYADDDILVCDKPAGIESVAFFEQIHAVYGSAIFTHRLDRNTSGVMIFALNEKAYAELFRGFRERTFDKEYLACVYGHFAEPIGILKDYLIKDEKAGKVKVYKERRKGSLMIETGYKELARGEKTSVLSVKLYTGRTHQIRAHLAFYGHFIIGDGKYGDDRINREFGESRQLLRAVKLALRFGAGDYLYRLNGKSFTVEANCIFRGLR